MSAPHNFHERLAALESIVADLADAHDALDAQHEHLFYKLQFVMDLVKVHRRASSVILDANDQPRVIEGTLTEFFARDGEAYIAVLKAQADAIQKRIAAGQTIADAARDTLAGLREGERTPDAPATDSAAGDRSGEAASTGPRLVPAQA